MSNFLMRFISILLGTNFVFFTLMGNSWPNWLGPNFDGSIEESLSGFEDLQMEWQKNVGEGWSAPVISDKTVFLHDRSGDVESLTAYELSGGQEKWRYSLNRITGMILGWRTDSINSLLLKEFCLVIIRKERYMH